MRSEHVTQSNSGVVQKSSIRKLHINWKVAVSFTIRIKGCVDCWSVQRLSSDACWHCNSLYRGRFYVWASGLCSLNRRIRKSLAPGEYFTNTSLVLPTFQVVHHASKPQKLVLYCFYRELTNRRLLHDAAVRLRDMLTAHAFLSTCQLRAKGDDVGESDLPAS